MEITRRTFVTSGACAASAAALGAACLHTEQAQAVQDVELPEGILASDLEYSAVELGEISDFALEETYDIVVVGAGCSGVPAVLTAIEEGATVACLQKEETAAANGSGVSAVVRSQSTEAGIKRWMADWAQLNGWRMNWELFNHYVDYSEEAVSWLIQQGIAAGCEPVKYEGPDSVKYEDGQVAAVIKMREPSNQQLMETLAAKAADEGAVFYYATPAVQLVQEDDGTVTGVIGKQSDGTYVKLNATKGVILAAGDYMNNPSMVSRYAADTEVFWRKQFNRTGDGHILGTLAGGRIAPSHHARQIHGLIGPFMTTPLPMVNPDGKRFVNETATMTDWNAAMYYCYHDPEVNYVFRFFDAALNEKYTGVPQLETIDKSIDDDTTIYYFRADTLEELCEKVGLPAEQTVATIERYNEMALAGGDEDYGVPGALMQTVDTAPFYCLRDRPGLAAINGGVMVDGHYQIVDADRNPIPHLFGAGVDAGNICGGINWNMPGGASDSHCFTAGRYTVIYALTGGMIPQHPASFEDIEANFKDENGNYPWQGDGVKSAISPW